MIEIERKILLQENQFAKLHEKLKKFHKNTINHINYYYDTTELDLFNKNTTMRIRQKNRTLLLECKYDKKYLNGVRTSKEYSISFDTLPNVISLTETNGDLLLLKQIGTLLTIRSKYDLYGYDVVLDMNWYLGIIDYELEIEQTPLSQLEYEKELLELLNVDHNCTATGKYTRFVEQFKKNIFTNTVYQFPISL